MRRAQVSLPFPLVVNPPELVQRQVDLDPTIHATIAKNVLNIFDLFSLGALSVSKSVSLAGGAHLSSLAVTVANCGRTGGTASS